MQSENTQQRAGVNIAAAVFVSAIIFTAALIWLGVSGQPWPKWLLALTTFL